MDTVKGLTHAVIEQPTSLHGASNEHTASEINWIACQFRLEQPVHTRPFPGRGNINLHTYEVTSGGTEFLLQKVNSDVFTMPHRVMSSMLASIESQTQALSQSDAPSYWVPITLVPTHDGKSYLDLTDDRGWSVWRLMVRIPEALSYKSLGELPDREDQLRLAEEVGRGLAVYSDLTASIDAGVIEGSLPGYRDTAIYFAQLHSVLEGNRKLDQAERWLPTDPIVKASTEQHFLVPLEEAERQQRLNDPELQPFLQMVLEHESAAMKLWNARADGAIRNTVIHGDTKIENFLFCPATGRAKALVDLDTIMPFTWLADWGDMQRSMVNVAGEREPDLSRVVVDEGVYEAVAKGFLNSARMVTNNEIDLMGFAVQAITLELGTRFLTDYLRGDTYFRLGEGDEPDLNKVRAMVQLELFHKLLQFGPRAEEIIEKYRPPRNSRQALHGAAEATD